MTRRAATSISWSFHCGETYLTLAKLQLELEAFLGVGVDIATPGAIGPRLAERVNRDLRPF